MNGFEKENKKNLTFMEKNIYFKEN